MGQGGTTPRAVLALALIALALPAGARAAGPVEDACDRADERAGHLCFGAEKLVDAASAACRYGADPDGAVCPRLGPRVSRAAVRDYAASWTHRALMLQYALTADVPFRDHQWVGTHNSYNSTAEMGPTLSGTDSNQQLPIVDQLDMDVRSLELDAHWFPRLASAGRAPVVCHARPSGEAHAGCSVEKPLDEVLGQIASWLDREGREREVLLLYLEDHLEGGEGHAAGAAAIERTLGERVYRPPAGGCRELPLELTREQVLAAGKQVVIVSDCGPGAGAAWASSVFTWDEHLESRPVGYRDISAGAGACGPDFTRAQYDATLIRYFEDSTGLTAGTAAAGRGTRDEGITPATAAAMTRCGVDLTGMDQLLPDDGRLAAHVWSWAPGEPAAAGDCAVQSADTRWRARDCRERRRAACRSSGGTFELTARPVRADQAERACAREAAAQATPRTGYENELLRQAAGEHEVWLGLRRDGAGWRATDRR